ncbi:MAG: hypothetical protein QNK37_34685 [Acidobacteriota bacterium]|nr:hypothetical protein [Acidobacteriota bacterium]
MTDDFLSELKSQLADREFADIQDAETFIGQQVQQHQSGGLDDFFGLSPEQMHLMLYRPFDSPEIATFPKVLDHEPKAAILLLVSRMMSYMGTKSVRLNKKENLPLRLCHELTEAYMGREMYERSNIDAWLKDEDQFPILSQFRWTMNFAGFLDIKKTTIRLTPDFFALYQRSGFREIYPRLFHTYCEEYNWAADEWDPEYKIIQQAVPFHLYLYKRFGNQWRNPEEYFSFFQRAFPQTVALEGGSEQTLANVYRERVCDRWSYLFGIVEFREEGETRIRASSLLDQLVHFSPQIKKLLK